MNVELLYIRVHQLHIHRGQGAPGTTAGRARLILPSQGGSG
jgi:hypothetical protein